MLWLLNEFRSRYPAQNETRVTYCMWPLAAIVHPIEAAAFEPQAHILASKACHCFGAGKTFIMRSAGLRHITIFYMNFSAFKTLYDRLCRNAPSSTFPQFDAEVDMCRVPNPACQLAQLLARGGEGHTAKWQRTCLLRREDKQGVIRRLHEVWTQRRI